MAMSDCEKCWETPCVCGYKFKDYTHEYMMKYIVGILQYRSPAEAKLLLQGAMERINQQIDEITENDKV